jgi:hypothetical protein
MWTCDDNIEHDDAAKEIEAEEKRNDWRVVSQVVREHRFHNISHPSVA